MTNTALVWMEQRLSVRVQAYLDRLDQRPRRIIASLNDSDFDEKVQTVIHQKLEVTRFNI